MKYTYNDKEHCDTDDIYGLMEENLDDEHYDAVLDSCDEEVHIGSLTYSPSEVLKAVDPVAYREFQSEEVDACAKEVIYELQHCEVGESVDSPIGEFTLTEE